MSLTFLFWLSLFYTIILFGTQVYEMVTPGSAHLNVTLLNAFYLALMSAYVGGKEIKRWKDGEGTPIGRPLWLRGEWFVGLWALYLPVAVILPQLWPTRFVYPEGLTLIAFEVLAFYVGSSASAWLNQIKEGRKHEDLDRALATETDETPAPPPRLQQKRLRYEKKILEAARSKDGITREEVEKLLNLSRAAALRLLSSMVDRQILVRTGDVGDRRTLYKAACRTPSCSFPLSHAHFSLLECPPKLRQSKVGRSVLEHLFVLPHTA